MDTRAICSLIDALTGGKDEAAEITKALNDEVIINKLKVLVVDVSSKKLGASIVTKCSDIMWNNDDASTKRMVHVRKAMLRKKEATEENEQMFSFSQGDDHDPMNISNIGSHDNHPEINVSMLTNDQKSVLNALDENLKSGKQMLFLCHGAAGSGKSTVMQKIKDKLSIGGKRIIVVCPTGIAATLIDRGTTIHHTFSSRSKNVTEEMIKNTFAGDVIMIIVDELSMIASDFIVIMDRKLR